MRDRQENSHNQTTLVPPCLAQIGDAQCTGCAACANACPQQAIGIHLNIQGFYRPVLWGELCDRCNFCIKCCPVSAVLEPVSKVSHPLNNSDVYAAWSTDEYVHRSSSSGGVFSEISRYVLLQGGAVCGCEWGEGWTPRHVIVKDWSEIARLRGSKYIPSYVDENFYREVIALAKAGTLVLFCGTPCQVAGLQLIAPSSARRNLLLVDLVCHGVPSLTSFWHYLDWKFDSREQVSSFSFRNKELSVQTIRADTQDGKKYLAVAGNDIWFRTAMVFHLFLQRSCFNCHFGSCNRSGDLTLGDFWGIPEEWHNRMGDSVVLASTEKGREILAKLFDHKQLTFKKSNFNKASRNVGRLRGASYPLPRLRPVAIHLLTAGRSFAWVYYICYQPLHFIERVIGFLQRRSSIIRKFFVGQEIH